MIYRDIAFEQCLDWIYLDARPWEEREALIEQKLAEEREAYIEFFARPPDGMCKCGIDARDCEYHRDAAAI